MPLESMHQDALSRGFVQGIFSMRDVQFARRLARLFGETREEVVWMAALVSRQEGAGHVCADLGRLEAEGIVIEREGVFETISALPPGCELEEVFALLRESPLVSAISRETGKDVTGPRAPIVLDRAGRLYLLRSDRDEEGLAALLRDRVDREPFAYDANWADAAIDRLVATEGDSTEETDLARAALRSGLERAVGVITGGPGTGKTTLLARVVALLAEERIVLGEAPLRVCLLAPTGKAAAAMSASFERQRALLDVDPAVWAAVPDSAQTIHRFVMRHVRTDALGRPGVIPAKADVLVIDEASMVDLSLMRCVFEVAVDVDRIVLLGDPDQLASVGAGAVLSEICAVHESGVRERGQSHSKVKDLVPVVRLEKSHRFSESSGIGRLAAAIRAGDADRALEILLDPAFGDVEWVATESPAEVQARLVDSAIALQGELSRASGPDEKLVCLDARRVLCAHRGGPLGVEALCRILDAAAAKSRRTTSLSGWWAGRLVLVTRNAPEQDLWNGDVGIVEETHEGLRAIFGGPDGRARWLSEGRLPSIESAVAMSVHKSQGSEFDSVDLVLGHVPSRLMTRELFYTGVTRARERLTVFASEVVLRAAIRTRVVRDSSLAARMRP